MLIIDRFEGEYAVCEEEDGSLKKLPKVFLPHLFLAVNSEELTSELDSHVNSAATAQRRQEIRRMLEDLYSQG